MPSQSKELYKFRTKLTFDYQNINERVSGSKESIKREIIRSLTEKAFFFDQEKGWDFSDNVIDSLIIKDFAENFIKIRFKQFDSAEVYLVDYEERQGSLTIEFTILIIASIPIYQTYRDAIDKILTDLSFFLSGPRIGLVENQLDTSNIELPENQRPVAIEVAQLSRYAQRIALVVLIIGILTFFAGCYFYVTIINITTKVNDELITKSDMTEAVNEKIEKVLERDKINYLFLQDRTKVSAYLHKDSATKKTCDRIP